MNMNTKQLAELKPGDKVVISDSHQEDMIGTVTRLTKTQIVVGVGPNQYKFKKKTGSQIGNQHYYYNWLSDRPIEEVRKRNHRVNTANKIESFCNSSEFDKLTDDQVYEIFAIINQ